jgi:citrate synthase
MDPGYKTRTCSNDDYFPWRKRLFLRYRGYSIEDLANRKSLAGYLVIFSANCGAIRAIWNDIKYTLVNEEMKSIIDGFLKQHILWGCLPHKCINSF